MRRPSGRSPNPPIIPGRLNPVIIVAGLGGVSPAITLSPTTASRREEQLILNKYRKESSRARSARGGEGTIRFPSHIVAEKLILNKYRNRSSRARSSRR